MAARHHITSTLLRSSRTSFTQPTMKVKLSVAAIMSSGPRAMAHGAT
jgi:hypothetical protein